MSSIGNLGMTSDRVAPIGASSVRGTAAARSLATVQRDTVSELARHVAAVITPTINRAAALPRRQSRSGAVPNDTLANTAAHQNP